MLNQLQNEVLQNNQSSVNCLNNKICKTKGHKFFVLMYPQRDVIHKERLSTKKVIHKERLSTKRGYLYPLTVSKIPVCLFDGYCTTPCLYLRWLPVYPGWLLVSPGYPLGGYLYPLSAPEVTTCIPWLPLRWLHVYCVSPGRPWGGFLFRLMWLPVSPEVATCIL